MSRPNAPEGRTYETAISALNTLQTNHSILAALRAGGKQLNSLALPEMREYLLRIGYTPADLTPLNVIHISGTKGKGSTCAFTSHILSQYPELLPPGRTKVGLYTSPHLRSVRERIRIDNSPISRVLFARYFWEVWDRLGAAADEKGTEAVGGTVRPVYFRYLTLMAFHAYLSEGVGAVVLEVGIGGEYDSTNIVEKPVATGVARLGLDHVNLLGNTIGEIAWHKSGIFKPGVAAYSVLQPEEAVDVLENRAKERQVEGGRVRWVETLGEGPELGLQGDFQRGNAALAVAVSAAALRVISGGKNILEGGNEEGEMQLPEGVKRGLKGTVWPGRCQVLEDKVVGGERLEWCLDGAHTAESLEVAGKWFVQREHKMGTSQGRGRRRRILLFNQQTRDAKALLETLHTTLTENNKLPVFDHVFFTTNVTRKTGYSADLVSVGTDKDEVENMVVQRALEKEWERLEHDAGIESGETGDGDKDGVGEWSRAKRWVTASIEEAVEKIRELAIEGAGEEANVVVLCTGSLHLVGGALEVLDDGEEEE